MKDHCSIVCHWTFTSVCFLSVLFSGKPCKFYSPYQPSDRYKKLLSFSSLLYPHNHNHHINHYHYILIQENTLQAHHVLVRRIQRAINLHPCHSAPSRLPRTPIFHIFILILFTILPYFDPLAIAIASLFGLIIHNDHSYTAPYSFVRCDPRAS